MAGFSGSNLDQIKPEERCSYMVYDITALVKTALFQVMLYVILQFSVNWLNRSNSKGYAMLLQCTSTPRS